MNKKGAIVVGASSGVGRAIASELASNGWSIVVASREQSDLDELATDLRGRYNVGVTPIAFDLTHSDQEIAGFLEAAEAALNRVDAVLITAGAIAQVDEGTEDWATTSLLLNTNLLGVMNLAGRCISAMEAAGHGTVVLFSSIATAAPRSRNVAYTAAKAGLESFGRSMRHRLARSPVSIQICVLGYVDTRMAQGQRLLLPAADPAKVACTVVAGLNQGSRIAYIPRWWGLVARVLRTTPWVLFRRLRF